MTINLQKPDITELKPRITVFGVGGGGGNAVNNMINSGLDGVEFVVANTDAQALTMSKAGRLVQLGVAVTEGLGAGSQPEVGRAAAEECIDEINDHLTGTHMAFVTAGMGGGTGTGAAPVVAQAARDKGILTVGVVTKPFSFEGKRRMSTAESGIDELQKHVDTLIVIPNQNLFRIANDKTTFSDAFSMADQVLYSGVACITDLMVKEGLINLDFADVRSVMREMGRAMMGTGEASSEGRAMAAAEAAISNPLLDETSMSGAQGLLISITGGRDMTLFEVDEAATRIREEVDPEANIILGATFDESLEGIIRVSVVATGIDGQAASAATPQSQARMDEAAERLRQSAISRPLATPAALVSPTPVVEQATSKVSSVEEELAIPKPVAPMTITSEKSVTNAQGSKPDEAEKDYSDPISSSDFQSALEAEISTTQASSARMPQASDFSPVAQKELSSETRQSSEDNGPMGLLKRLATGLSGSHATEASSPSTPATSPSTSESDSTSTSAPQVSREDNNPYAPPKNGALDVHGRAATPSKLSSDDDQLDIPAFLRRQAN